MDIEHMFDTIFYYENVTNMEFEINGGKNNLRDVAIADKTDAQFSLLDDESESTSDIEHANIVLMDDITAPVSDKAHTVCFSGHRPERLPQGRGLENIIKSYIAYEVSEAIDAGYNTFIMGGSRGVDLWSGLAVLHEKIEDPDIKLIAALPYYASKSRFTERDRFDYGYILERADEVFYASRDFNHVCIKRRNLFMVENSSRIIAFVKDYRSGTGQTIRMAERLGLEMHVYNIENMDSF
jgi:uncharacterized phage-like protein YoqJ